MAFSPAEINEIKNAIKDGLVEGFGPIANDIENIYRQQKSGIPKSALDYRGLNFNERNLDINERLRRLEQRRDFQAQETKASTRFGGQTIFGDIEKSFREFRYEQQRLSDASKDYADSIKDLKKILKDSTLSEAEAIEKAKQEIESLDSVIEKLRGKYDSLIDSVENHDKFTEDVKKEILKAIENVTSADTKEDVQSRLNSIAGKKFFSKEKAQDIINYKKHLKDITDKEGKRTKLATSLAEAYSKGTEELREQARYADLAMNTMKEGIHNIEKGFGKIKNVVTDFADAWRKVDAASSKFVKNVGMGNRGLVALRRNTIEAVGKRGLGFMYNISMEELLGIQQDYSKAVGRNIGISNNDQENAAAMSLLMGAKGGELAAALENFGMSYSDSARIAGKMFSDASKYGLNFEKYSENFLQNIKLAQNYTFKDGLKGLERMAKVATEIKLDMSQIAGFADKVSTLEGAVQTSASLQVLGGAFARFSDPLGMLYEGLNDIEKLQDRVVNITSTLGAFNEKTGQVEVSAFNRQRLRAAAPAMGMSYEQLMESVQAQARRGYVEKQLGRGGRRFTDEEREFLLNTATVNNGVAEMSFINNKGQRITKDVNKMSSAEIKEARTQNSTDSDNIKDIAKNVRSFNDKFEGIKKGTEAIKANMVEGPMNWINKKLDNIVDYLGIIKLAVIGIAGAKLAGGIINMAGGVTQVAGGAWNFTNAGRSFMRGARQAGINNLKLGKTASLAQKVGYGLSSFGGGSLGAGIAGVTGILGTIAAAVYGIHGVIKANNDRKEHEKNVAKGLVKKGSKEDQDKISDINKRTGKYRGLAAGATSGALIGAFGGPIGIAIGAALGAGIGYFGGGAIGTGIGNKEIAKRKEEAIRENRLNKRLSEKGFNFQGGYTEQEYLKIIEAIKRGGDNTISKSDYGTLSDEIKDKLIKSGDISMFPDLQEFAVDETSIQSQNTVINGNEIILNGDLKKVKKENGGILSGPSHKNGGMPILGSNIEVEGGEYVVNRRATEKYHGLLDNINSMGKGGIIAPKSDSFIKPITVLPVSYNSNTGGINNSINNGPIDVNMNINGTIKLDGGNGVNIDINELLRDPVFVRQMTELVQKEIIYKTKGARYTTKL